MEPFRIIKSKLILNIQNLHDDIINFKLMFNNIFFVVNIIIEYLDNMYNIIHNYKNEFELKIDAERSVLNIRKNFKNIKNSFEVLKNKIDEYFDFEVFFDEIENNNINNRNQVWIDKKCNESKKNKNLDELAKDWSSKFRIISLTNLIENLNKKIEELNNLLMPNSIFDILNYETFEPQFKNYIVYNIEKSQQDFELFQKRNEIYRYIMDNNILKIQEELLKILNNNNIKLQIEKIFKTLKNICQLNTQFNAQKSLFEYDKSSLKNNSIIPSINTTRMSYK